MYSYSYWTNPPNAFLPGSAYAPVPGWGVNPAIIGPARVGVGGLGQSGDKWLVPHVGAEEPLLGSSFAQIAQQIQTGGGHRSLTESAPGELLGLPWYYWLAGGAMVAGGVALAYNMKLLGR